MAPQPHITLREIRTLSEKLMALFPAKSDIIFSSISFPNCKGLWIKAPQASSSKMLLFFHGGGYISGSAKGHQDMLGRISKYGEVPICAVDYRLAPEYPFPAAVDDALDAYQNLLNYQGWKPEQIIVGGSSAGGGLAMALLLKLKELCLPLPKAGILICPWVDLAAQGNTLYSNNGFDLIRREHLITARDAYLGSYTNPYDPFASPLYGDLSHLPPLLIQAGTIEIIWSEIEAFVQKARESDVLVTFEPYPGMFHTWQLFASKIPEGDQALQSIGQYILNLKH